MSFYIYQLVEPLILPNTSSSLSAISYKEEDEKEKDEDDEGFYMMFICL